MLKPVYWFSAMKKSYELLTGKRPLCLFLCIWAIWPFAIVGLLVGCLGDWVCGGDKFGFFLRIVRKT